jgi:glycosyltransferase involved in cell wall biosynthesis
MKNTKSSLELAKDPFGGFPRISIITPSLNQGRFIRRTIESVLSQNYPNLEYLVMDGGSSDNTLDVLNSYSGRVKWVSENDKGQTHAINKGLRMATGDIVAYLNADDLLLPDSLLKVARAFMDNPNVLWVTGKCRIISDNDREIRRWLTAYKNFWLRIRSHSVFLVMDYISQPATFWRADALTRLGFLDESLHYVMDYDYWLRLYAESPPVFIPEYLAAFRLHVASKTTAKTSSRAGGMDRYLEEEGAVIQRHTRSRLLFLLYRIHRWLMLRVYFLLNMR